MVLNITGIYFFMPVFSFLFVFVVVYAVLAKTKVLGEQKVNLLVSFVMAIIFMNFSSMQLYVETIIPWFIVLLVCVFLVLLIGGFSTELKNITKPAFGWFVIVLLIIIFLIAAIKVFNPVFHPDYIVTNGDSPQIISQIRNVFDSQVSGTILLLIVAGIVTWVLVRKGKKD